jgi:hypothetical protein
MRKQLVAAAVVTGLCLSTSPAPLHPRVAEAAVKCGTERWSIKTLSDPDAEKVNYKPEHRTVQYLRTLPRPDVHEDSPRLRPYEFRSYRVRAKLLLAAKEDDHDFHVVIGQPHHGKRRMIVEFPDPQCKGPAGSIKRDAMARARRQLLNACGTIGSSFTELHGIAVIKGVAFFDFDHGQTGVAPNAIELHPALKFRMVRGHC